MCPFPGKDPYVESELFSVKIDGKARPLQGIKGPWRLGVDKTQKVGGSVRIATQGEYGSGGAALEPGCHKVELTIDPKAWVRERREHNNRATLWIATGGATCEAHQKRDRCSFLSPQPLRLNRVSLAAPNRPKKTLGCGLIGVAPGCTGAASFTNNNGGDLEAELEVVLRGRARFTGPADVIAYDRRVRFNGVYAVTGDLMHHEPGGKPDSSLEVWARDAAPLERRKQGAAQEAARASLDDGRTVQRGRSASPTTCRRERFASTRRRARGSTTSTSSTSTPGRRPRASRRSS